jgi:hypothetical protein
MDTLDVRTDDGQQLLAVVAHADGIDGLSLRHLSVHDDVNTVIARLDERQTKNGTCFDPPSPGHRTPRPPDQPPVPT